MKYFILFFILGVSINSRSAVSSLDAWIKVLEKGVPEDQLLKAPHEIFKIESSRAHAKLLANAYRKYKANLSFRYAVLEELVQHQMITTLDGWQSELISNDFTFEQKLNLNNGLELRENAIKNLYKEARVKESYSCKMGRKKLNLEVLTDSQSQFLWVTSAGHYFYTGVKGSFLPEMDTKNSLCPPVFVYKLSKDNLVLFASNGGTSAIVLEMRKMRPVKVISMGQGVSLNKIIRINDRYELCFLRSKIDFKSDAKKSWYCTE